MNIRLCGELWITPQVVQLPKSLYTTDCMLCNLESPITKQKNEIVKSGITLKGENEDFARWVKPFKNPPFFSLANNHVGDFGEKGILDTITVCEENRVLYGGVSRENTLTPVEIITPEASIAVICVGEKQFGISQKNRVGTDYVSPRLYSVIREAKTTHDIVILSIHAAAEMFPVPAPLWQEQLRSYIDCGVDIIHGHHSHVPQGWERYHDGWIFYGLGNFCVRYDRWKWAKNTLWSLSADIKIQNRKIQEVNVIPLEMCRRETDINDSTREVSIREMPLEKYADYVKMVNEPLSKPDLLAGIWQEFSIKMYESFFGPVLYTRSIEILDQSLKSRIRNAFLCLKNRYDAFIPNYGRKPTPQELALNYHLFSCISHQLAIETAIGVQFGELEDFRTSETRKIVDEFFQIF
ncbi:MAG: CapA family protein [Planctomycetia bacterium]|nr:CapA family protein [Planctomycetia bacterium]